MNYWTDKQLDSVHKMLNPRSIAIVGATERMQYGGRFLKSVLAASEKVRVYPVNPRYDELMGLRCYSNVKDLPESPDLVGIIVPYEHVIPVMKESAAKGAGSAIVISAGFAERGLEARRNLQEELGQVARDTGVRIAGPNCLGLANVKSGIWACAASSTPSNKVMDGNIGLVCQSGASAFGPFLSRAISRGIGYSYIISTGNEADLEASDFMRYLIDDDNTRVIAVFIEGFKDARKFLAVAKLAAEKSKPIIAIKIGRSESGTHAARSHTAAMTGADDVYEAAFKQYGVARVDDWDALLEGAQILASSVPTTRPGIALLSHSGGVCSLTADLLGQEGLELPPLAESARDGINEILGGFGWASNPADVTGHANRDTVQPIMKHMIEDPEVGALVVASSASETQAQHIVALSSDNDKLITFLYTGNEIGDAGGLDTLKRARIPVFYSPRNLAKALSNMQWYWSWKKRRLSTGFGKLRTITPRQREVAKKLICQGMGALSEYNSKRLIQAWGITSTVESRASTVEEALTIAHEIGYPVVLKIDTEDILHKTEAGALVLNIRDDEGLREAYSQIITSAKNYAPLAKIRGVVVQETVTALEEVIIGVKRDAQLGPVIIFGSGGTLVELAGDVAIRVCPIHSLDAEEMVNEVKVGRLLRGYRGKRRGDMSSLIDILVNVSDLAMNLSNCIEEIDINPLAVLPEGQGVKALDALVVLGNSLNTESYEIA